MSLVERALKKLQESRTTTPASADVVHSPIPVLKEATTRPLPDQTLSQRFEPISLAPAPQQRVVKIDRETLRGMELLPPVNIERQIASQYQQIKRALVDSALGKSGTTPNGHLIMLASALPGEGKTFTSLNLALSMAREKDIEVLLVDADVAKPHLTRIFDLRRERGLIDLLTDTHLHPNSVIFPTDEPNLSVLPAGHQIETATELLASARMDEVAKQLGKQGRRIVLFDSPPLLLSTESRALVHIAGQVVLIVRADSTAQKAVFDAIELIGDSRPISLILNQSEAPASSGYYGYGTYGDAASETAR